MQFQFLMVLGDASLLPLLRIQGNQDVRSETSVSDAKKLRNQPCFLLCVFGVCLKYVKTPSERMVPTFNLFCTLQKKHMQ